MKGRSRYGVPREPRTSYAPESPLARRSTSDSDHLVLQTGRRCPCGEPASQVMRCVRCRAVIATCGGHGKTALQMRAEHCAGAGKDAR